MKRCLKCGRVYADENLNFCLDDGELLVRDYPDPSAGNVFDEPPTAIFAEPPTILSDPTRVTSPTGWPEPTMPKTSPVYQPPAYPAAIGLQRTPDQTIAIVALVLGILSLIFVCCYGGFWLGLPAAIVGFFGMRKADTDPQIYGGKPMAIVGAILGIISFIISFLLLIAGLFHR